MFSIFFEVLQRADCPPIYSLSPICSSSLSASRDSPAFPPFTLEKQVTRVIVTMLRAILEIVVALVVFGAWVTGMLDPAQSKLQEILLDFMGETKISYGLKKSLTGKKLAEDKNLSKIQDQLGDNVSGIFGKGGVGHGLGAGLSKNL